MASRRGIRRHLSGGKLFGNNRPLQFRSHCLKEIFESDKSVWQLVTDDAHDDDVLLGHRENLIRGVKRRLDDSRQSWRLIPLGRAGANLWRRMEAVPVKIVSDEYDFSCSAEIYTPDLCVHNDCWGCLAKKDGRIIHLPCENDPEMIVDMLFDKSGLWDSAYACTDMFNIWKYVELRGVVCRILEIDETALVEHEKELPFGEAAFSTIDEIWQYYQEMKDLLASEVMKAVREQMLTDIFLERLIQENEEREFSNRKQTCEFSNEKVRIWRDNQPTPWVEVDRAAEVILEGDDPDWPCLDVWEKLNSLV